MTADIGRTVLGLSVLLGGAWFLVRSATRLAGALGLSPVIIGATVVAFGTSAPEFVVSVAAAAEGSTGLAIGSVFGSNVLNAALVIGIAAVLNPLDVDSRLLRREMPILGAATVVVILMGVDGAIGRVEGLVLFATLLVFVGMTIRTRHPPPDAPDAPRVESRHGAPPRVVARDLVIALGSIVALAAGSEAIVRGATGIATTVGLSDLVIGATVVAVGTSLPELTTTVVAAIRKQTEIAIANVVGSNIFNLLGVLGLAAAVSPLPIGYDLYRFEVPAVAASTIALILLAWQGSRISRGEGGFLLALYIVFVVTVLVRGAAA